MESARPRKPIVTVIGDSTIDNKVWVGPGIKHNYIRGKLGIKRASTATRIKRSHSRAFKTELSVVEHLMDIMPGHQIRDLTNDGFTTRDVLDGAPRNKVFGNRLPKFFPDTFFAPLTEGERFIEESDYIVLSVGGNNIREFLQTALRKGDEVAIRSYIRDNFGRVKKELKDEYLEIVNRIKVLNPNAKIILMTQYYPSFMQNDYNIYGFMKILGEVLGYGNDEADAIHRLMIETYQEIFARLGEVDNVIAADVTSTLNPFDKKNHSHQIEPSGQGGKQIAHLLKEVVEHGDDAIGLVHDLSYPNGEERLTARRMQNWQPRHPHSFTDMDCHELIKTLEQAIERSDSRQALSLSGYAVVDAAKELLKDIRPESAHEIAVLKDCLNTTITAIRNPNEANVQALQTKAKTAAPGKSSFWKQFLGVLSVVAGAILIGLGIAGVPFTGGFSAIGIVPGIALFGAGIAGIKKGEQHGISRAMSNLGRDSARLNNNPEDESSSEEYFIRRSPGTIVL